MKKIKEIVKELQNDSLGEAFLLTAIESYSRQVMADDSDWGKSLVSKEAWQLIAEHNLNLIEGDKNGV